MHYISLKYGNGLHKSPYNPSPKKSWRAVVYLYTCILAILLSIIPQTVYGQADSATPSVDTASVAVDSVVVPVEPFRNKIGIRTNVVDWVATIPNVGFEYEVKRSPYYKNPYTIGAVVRWNWNTWSRYTPSTVFNVFDIRIEGRKYWSTYLDRSKAKRLKPNEKPGYDPKDKEKNSKPERLKDRLYEITSQKYENGGMGTTADTVDYWHYLYRQLGKIDRAEPNEERGYYFGFYMGYHNYSYKLGSTGRQGNAFSAGITGGYTIPLYSYNDRYIDLDLGGSLGIFYTKYDEYRHDPESNCYPIVAAGEGAIFPMVTELRLALVYRFQSVRQKTLTDKQGRSERLQYLSDQETVLGRLNDSIMKVRQLHADSVKLAKENAKLERALQDSLQQVRKAFVKDSIKQAKLNEKLMADSLIRLRQMLVDSGGYAVDTLGLDTLKDVNEAVRRAALALGLIQPEPVAPLEGEGDSEDGQPGGKRPEDEDTYVIDQRPLWVEDWKTMNLLHPEEEEQTKPEETQTEPPAGSSEDSPNDPPAEGQGGE